MTTILTQTQQTVIVRVPHDAFENLKFNHMKTGK